jgi:hypothetical protein
MGWLTYEGASRSFRTGRLERELHMVQLSATRCSCIAILWVSLVSFAATTLCVASQRVFIIVSVHFVIDSVRKLSDDTPSYNENSYAHFERQTQAVTFIRWSPNYDGVTCVNASANLLIIRNRKVLKKKKGDDHFSNKETQQFPACVSKSYKAITYVIQTTPPV